MSSPFRLDQFTDGRLKYLSGHGPHFRILLLRLGDEFWILDRSLKGRPQCSQSLRRRSRSRGERPPNGRSP
jgi:hypothetical protein